MKLFKQKHNSLYPNNAFTTINLKNLTIKGVPCISDHISNVKTLTPQTLRVIGRLTDEYGNSEKSTIYFPDK